jgi:hypothetical protein
MTRSGSMNPGTVRGGQVVPGPVRCSRAQRAAEVRSQTPMRRKMQAERTGEWGRLDSRGLDQHRGGAVALGCRQMESALTRELGVSPDSERQEPPTAEPSERLSLRDEMQKWAGSEEHTPLPGPSPATADGRDGLDQRHELGDVVAVAAGHGDRQRDAGAADTHSCR